MLGGLERRLERFEGQFGRPTTFGGYLLHVAKALGIQQFIVWKLKPIASYDTGTYRLLTTSEAESWCGEREHQFRERTKGDGI